MIQQMQAACNECRGKGETIRDKDRCPTCDGKKLIPEPKVLEVHVDKGMIPGQAVSFYGEGEQEPGLEPGDIIVTLKEKKDPEVDSVFRRIHDGHLLYRHTLTLSEALTGFDFYLRHLDGRFLHITSEKGDVIKPGDTKIIENEGMPIHKRPFDKGRLIIQFEVVFPQPEDLDDSKREALKALFPRQPRSEKPNQPDVIIEEVSIRSPEANMNPDGSAKRQKSDHDDHMEEDEDDDGQQRRGGAQTAQCMNCIM